MEPDYTKVTLMLCVEMPIEQWRAICSGLVEHEKMGTAAGCLAGTRVMAYSVGEKQCILDACKDPARWDDVK